MSITKSRKRKRRRRMFSLVRFVIAMAFLLGGVGFAVVATIGIFKFKFVLNRMHAAAMCDTLALAMVCIGLMIMSGFTFLTLKLALVILFLWFASPVSSHLIARLEVTTDEKVQEECSMDRKE